MKMRNRDEVEGEVICPHCQEKTNLIFCGDEKLKEVECDKCKKVFCVNSVEREVIFL